LEVPVQAKTKVWKTSLRLPPKVKEILRQAALAEGVSMNELMVREVRRRVEVAEAEAADSMRRR
jgi:predicted HicB family RNase H-like nuclease